MHREIGGDSWSIATEAMISEARELIFSVSACSVSELSGALLAVVEECQAETLDKDAAMMCEQIYFFDQASRGILMRFFCSRNQLFERLGRCSRER